MAITIQMIETKEFKVKPSGYDPDEVDVFLDSIIDEFEDMQREITSLRAAARQKPAAPPPVAQPVAPESSETAQKLLATAQRVSDETMADARRQADVVIMDAKSKADKILEDARGERARLEEALGTLRSAAQDYRTRFKRLVDDQQHIINGETELFA